MDAVLNDDHPLALELASLRNAIARYQHEAHATSVKLQRHSLDTSYALERTHALESENSLLKAELAVLRAHPEIPPHPAALQVQELTIAHRRLSDKLTLTEGALLEYTAELAHARSDVTKSRHEIEATSKFVERLQTELKDAHAKERELGRKARAAEEERKLSDLVVQEYADLVRNLEGRPRPSTPSASTFSLDSANNNSSATLVDSLSEGKSGLQKLLEEFNSETERLETEIINLQGQINQLQVQLTAESRRAEDDRVETAQAQFELEKHKIDDNTAAKMVSRYMKFSQSSTDSLQKAMEGMKARHTATAATLRTEVEHLQKALLIERRQSEKLRHALDELTEDISREAYGRRREIALRLAFLGREEHLAEGLRRWIRRAREAFERALHATLNNQQEEASASVIGGVFKAIIRDADDLLDSLNGQPSAEGDPLGSVARIVVAQNAASTLARELQAETDRRLALERQWAQYHVTGHSTAMTQADPAVHAEPVPVPALPAANGDAPQQDTLEVERPLPVRTSSLTVTAPQQGTGTAPPRETTLATSNILSGALSESVPSSLATGSRDTDLAQVEQDLEPSRADSPVVPNAPDPVLTRETVSQSAPAPNESLAPVDLPATAAVLRDENISSVRRTIEQVSAAPETTPESGIATYDTSKLPFPAISEDTSEMSTSPINVSTLLHSTTQVLESTTPVVHVKASAKAPVIEVFPSSTPDVFSPVTTSPLDELKISPLTSQLLNGESTGSPSSRKLSLLPELLQVQHRYDSLQRGFRDCNLSLKDMKKDLSGFPHGSEMVLVLQKAVERLDDYNEDVRVELEIRVTDEARITSGYEALLTIPGAMSDEVDQEEMEVEIQAFVDGTDKAVAKAMQLFSRKLDDLEHDIAAVKRSLHELASTEEPHLATTPAKSPSWTSWTAGLLSPPRSTSPAPTFGSVMTSPRLRQTSFSHPRKASDDSASGSPDPFASLGLRIPMPAHVVPASPPQPVNARQRVASATYMLGLGARSTFGFPSKPSARSLTSAVEDAKSGEGDPDSDVE